MAKRKTQKGPERLTVNHSKDRNMVFVSFYDGNLSGTLEITPEQAIAIGDVGNMAKVYREGMEEMASEK
jgi:hypothetical protein